MTCLSHRQGSEFETRRGYAFAFEAMSILGVQARMNRHPLVSVSAEKYGTLFNFTFMSDDFRKEIGSRFTSAGSKMASKEKINGCTDLMNNVEISTKLALTKSTIQFIYTVHTDTFLYNAWV